MAKQAPKKPRAASKAAARDKARTAAELERLTPRKLTREQLIEALNDDLAWEYQALIQYVQHAAAISGAQYDAIKAELIVHSNEEHAHAVSLADQIDFLGGVPGVDVYEAPYTPRTPTRCSSRTWTVSWTRSPATGSASPRRRCCRSTACAVLSRTSSSSRKNTPAT